jgi:hypothetical protein
MIVKGLSRNVFGIWETEKEKREKPGRKWFCVPTKRCGIPSFQAKVFLQANKKCNRTGKYNLAKDINYWYVLEFQRYHVLQFF